MSTPSEPLAAPVSTPLPAESGYFLSLGAGTHQVPLIAAARRLGFPVVAVDRDLQAPGFADAAIQVQCSVLRPGRIQEMLTEQPTPVTIAGVGCRSFGRAALSAALLAERFDTPGNAPRSLHAFANKRRLKARLADADGVQVPRSFAFGTLAEREELRAADRPLLVRPARGHGKLGLRRLMSDSDRNRFLQIHLRDPGELLIEELIPSAREITVLGIVQNGRYHTLLLSDKRTSPEPPLYIELGHDFPAGLGDDDREAIDTTMQQIVSTTGLANGPMVAEFLLPGSNQATAARQARGPLLVECAPEIGGEFLADCMLPAARGALVPQTRQQQTDPARPGALNYFEELVRLYTGGKFRTDEFQAALDRPRFAVSLRFVPQSRDAELAGIALPTELEAHPDLLFARVLKQPGDTVRITGGNPDRLAVFALARPINTDPMADSAALQAEANHLTQHCLEHIHYVD